jgi:hypothetical protein
VAPTVDNVAPTVDNVAPTVDNVALALMQQNYVLRACQAGQHTLHKHKYIRPYYKYSSISVY